MPSSSVCSELADRLTRPLWRLLSMRAIGASRRGAGPGGAVRSRLASRSRKSSIQATRRFEQHDLAENVGDAGDQDARG